MTNQQRSFLQAAPVLALNALILWPAGTAAFLALAAVGLPVICIAAAFGHTEQSASKVWPDRLIATWPNSWMRALWGNEQDGIDGLPLAPADQVVRQAWWLQHEFTDEAERIVIWSALRNAVNNPMRFLAYFAPCLGWLNAGPIRSADIRWAASHHCVLCWQGAYAGLKFAAFGKQLWIGWKFLPDHADPAWWPVDPCWKGVGFAPPRFTH